MSKKVTNAKPGSLRSQDWFNNPNKIDMVAFHLERLLANGWTLKDLQSGKPIIGIAQTGSDIAPCNRHHLELAKRVREGIRDKASPSSSPSTRSRRRSSARLRHSIATCST